MEPGESSEHLRERLKGSVRRFFTAGDDFAERVNAAWNARFSGTEFVKVREHPKGTKIGKSQPGSVLLRVRAAIRFWWKAFYLMLILCVAAPFIGGPIGFAGGIMSAEAAAQRGVFDRAGFGDVFAGAFWTTVIMIGLTIWVFRLTRPWVEIYADANEVRVGSQRFDRTHYGHFRLGYEIQTSEGLLKNDFHDLDIGLQGLRLSYGLWGEDLPYLVNKYHANEIVLWLNAMIAQTAKPVEAAPIRETGQRQQEFG